MLSWPEHSFGCCFFLFLKITRYRQIWTILLWEDGAWFLQLPDHPLSLRVGSPLYQSNHFKHITSTFHLFYSRSDLVNIFFLCRRNNLYRYQGGREMRGWGWNDICPASRSCRWNWFYLLRCGGWDRDPHLLPFADATTRLPVWLRQTYWNIKLYLSFWGWSLGWSFGLPWWLTW